MSKKTITLFILAIIAIGIGAVAFINFSVAKRPVNDTSLESSDAAGTVKADKNSNLGFERTGKIIFIGKKIGDQVKEGEVLAKIDSADLSAQYAQAAAGVLVAQGDLAALQNSLKKEKLKLRGLHSNDKKIQKKQIASVENNITSQEARILQARDLVKNAKAQLDKNVIVAPFDGIITRLDIALGEVVGPNVSVITITANK